MTNIPRPGTRWRLFRDVVVFQIKLGLEALLDLTLIPVSLAAAGLDLVFGHWQQPRWFHRVLRFGESCERRLDLWGAAKIGEDASQAEVDAVKRGIEHLVRNSGIGPERVRELRRWAATRLAPGADDPPR
ncbi:MAG: hypothetical protein ACRC6L_07105 [Steroidobacteraceae bacterium]